LSVYLDASVLYSLISKDSHAARLDAWMATGPRCAFSAWTVTEVSSAFSHRVRLKQISDAQRRLSDARLDQWLNLVDPPLAIAEEDFPAARTLIQTFGLLRAPDALHLAIATRNSLTLATFDDRLADIAVANGMTIVDFGD
jgi:predicted nucleic acid-binding protein